MFTIGQLPPLQGEARSGGGPGLPLKKADAFFKETRGGGVKKRAAAADEKKRRGNQVWLFIADFFPSREIRVIIHNIDLSGNEIRRTQNAAT